MAIYLAGITHDTKQNTLEATWLQEVFDANNTLIRLDRFKCENYAPAQKADFLDALNTVGTPVDGTKYVVMAGW